MIPNPPAPKTTYYVGGFVYESAATTGQPEVLQYILNEEGKLRIMEPVAAWSGPSEQVNYLETRGNIEIANTGSPNKWGVWDYFIKDNLSNIRLVLTEEFHQQQMRCTMEIANTDVRDEEEATFSNTPNNNEVANTRIGTPSAWSGNTSPKSSKLFNIGVNQVGPNAILKVMAGDNISGMVKYFYEAGGASNNTSILNNVVNSLLWALGGSPNTTTIVKDNVNQTYLSSLNGPVTNFLNNQAQPGNGSTPKAYINYIFFDEQFRYVNDNGTSGATVVEPITSGTSKEGTLVIPFNTRATKNGYVYIYLSNESQNIPVYFDDLHIIHDRDAMVEDNAYYPYGLKIQGISAKAALKPKAKQGYQGDYCERDEETGYNEFALRFYDPQIGRWLSIDPYDEFYSPYIGMGNNPVHFIDKDGGGVGDPIITLSEVIVVASRKAVLSRTLSGIPAVINLAKTIPVYFHTFTNFDGSASFMERVAPQMSAYAPRELIRTDETGEVYTYSGGYATSEVQFTEVENPVLKAMRERRAAEELMKKFEFYPADGSKGLNTITSTYVKNGFGQSMWVPPTNPDLPLGNEIVGELGLFIASGPAKFFRAAKGVKLADDAFVHVTTPGGAPNILSKGLNPEISGFVTKYKYVKNVTNPSDFNTMLYSQKLWPQTAGKFDNGFNILHINAKPTFFSPRTNWVNGIPQYKFNTVVPPSKITLVK